MSQRFSRADAIFVATVVETTLHPTGEAALPEVVRAGVQVLEVLKGRQELLFRADRVIR